jgi:hypothetical protein
MDDQGKRAHLEKYFYSWIGVIHSEIAFRLGNADLARKKMGDLLNTFPQLAPAHQRLLISNCEVSPISLNIIVCFAEILIELI